MCFFSAIHLGARDLKFSEVTSNSFKTSWSPAGPGVLSYLVKYKVAIGEDEYFVSVPAPLTSTVLTNLLPQTTYTVSVIAEYEDGDGPPLNGEETTLEGIVPIVLHQFSFLKTKIGALCMCYHRDVFAAPSPPKLALGLAHTK